MQSICDPEAWTQVQLEEGDFFEQHWSAVYNAGGLDLKVPPDSVLYEQDLGRSLAYMGDLLGDLQGMRVLDLGCGPGDFTIFMARRGALVDAVDVAPAALEITQRRAEVNGVTRWVRTHLMPAERLSFDAETFDWVTGFGLLHHVDLDALGPEIVRVLKPGGGAIFREPLGDKPPVRWVRRYIPYDAKYHSTHEYALTTVDLSRLAESFREFRVHEFYLLSSINRLLGGESSVLFRVLYSLDSVLLRHVPVLRSWCRYVVVEYGV